MSHIHLMESPTTDIIISMSSEYCKHCGLQYIDEMLCKRSDGSTYTTLDHCYSCVHSVSPQRKRNIGRKPGFPGGIFISRVAYSFRVKEIVT